MPLFLCVANAYVPDIDNAEAEYNDAVKKIGILKSKLLESVDNKYLNNGESKKKSSSVKLQSNFEPEKFKDAVLKTKEYIKSGDIIQAVISQRWKTDLKVDPFDLYRALRVLNPSPYMFYLKIL